MLKFSNVFCNNMILQCSMPVIVWGYGAEGCVKAGFYGNGMTVERIGESAADGSFRIEFPPFEGGTAEYTLKAACGGEQTEIYGIVFGDVYLLLGQSNMTYTLSCVEQCDYWAERAAAANIRMRAFSEESYVSTEEVRRPVTEQKELAREFPAISGGDSRIKDMSALGVMISALMYEKTHIPVGAVDTSMGGLSIEAYLPRGLTEADGELTAFLKRTGRYISVEDYNNAGERNFSQLSGVYNEKIAPMYGLKFKAAVWYLGESYAIDYEHGLYFRRALKLIIDHYRDLFGDMFFAAVQIAPEYYPYGDGKGYLYVNESIGDIEYEREGYCAVPIYNIEPRWLIDDGRTFYHPIHPVNKAPVASAVADVIYRNVFNNEHYRYPRIDGLKSDGCGGLIAHIANCGNGLAGRIYNGFTVYGADGKHYPAFAERTGRDTLRIISESVYSPLGATYAFMQYQNDCNVRLKSGEPLLPYRTAREQIGKDYYAFPAFLSGTGKAVENCFGYQVGTCRTINSWERGQIYGAPCRISHITRKGTGKKYLKLQADAGQTEFFYFGASPRLFFSGQRNQLADYPYLKLSVYATGDVSFWGLAVRLSCGDVYRFPAGEDFIRLSEYEQTLTLSLSEAFREDMGRVSLTDEQRESIVEAEFLFRGKGVCAVYMGGLSYCSFSILPERTDKTEETANAATQLPKYDQ